MATARADLNLLNQPAVKVAPLLLGWRLVRQTSEGEISGMIVETEAYMGPDDAASHAYNGQTPRNAVMFGPPGRLYVYFTYGRHYCCNVVTGPSHHPSAVLIRALEPISGINLMQRHRGQVGLVNLTSGPAKLTQALEIGEALNGHDLLTKPLQLLPYRKPSGIITNPRIGITNATDKPWRFSIKENPYVSRPKPKTPL